MRNFAVLLAMVGVFTVLLGPAIGLSFLPETERESPAAALSSICAQDVAAAGAAGVVGPRSDALDPAVRSCASVKEWVAAARMHPAATGGADPRRILAARCRDHSAGLGRYATCRDLSDERLPAPISGSIVIPAPAIAERADHEPGVGVEIILDTSGSMLEKVGGERRIDIAKESLSTLVRDALADGVQVAIRTFHSTDDAAGSDRAGARSGPDRARGRRDVRTRRAEPEGVDPSGCLTKLTVPMGTLDRASMLELIGNLSAGKGTSTPIAASLAAAGEDLASVAGRRTIVLVTDGNETCGGDPLAEIGTVAGDALDIAPGIYDVRVMSVPPVVLDDVLIGEGQRVELALPEAA